MRLPRVRFTIRRLMTVVGTAGLGLGVLRAIERYHLEAEAIEVCSTALFLGFLAFTSVAVMIGPVVVLAILHERQARKRIG